MDNDICSYFGQCGGCSLQDQTAEKVALLKQHRVVEALASQGITAKVSPTLTSPMQSRRRVSFTIYQNQGKVFVGYYALKSHELIPITSCPISHPDISQSIENLIHFFTKLPMIDRARASLTVTNKGLDVEIFTDCQITKTIKESLPSLASSFNWSRLTWNKKLICCWHDPIISFGKGEVIIPAGGFIQATAYGERVLSAFAVYGIGEAKKIADLFSGAGTFTFPCAQKAEVTAFEYNIDLIQALEKGAKRVQGLKKITSIKRNLFTSPLTIKELEPFDAIIIDPPRAGAQAQMKILAQTSISHIVSISCNPNSFAKDSATLIENGYQIAKIIPIDQFLWSDHVEIASLFIKNG